MRIGQDDNFLSLEPRSLDGGFMSFRAEAAASASGRQFTALHDCVMLASDEETIRRFDHFRNFQSKEMELSLTEGGWLRFQRDARGHITVKYRIGGWKASAAMEGEVLVDGEFADNFCREFGQLLLST